MEIMTPENPRWEEFADRLWGPEGCDFLEKEEEKLGLISRCDATPKRPLARAILKKMGGIDIKATMQYFDDHGGHCDCEILLNTDYNYNYRYRSKD